MFTNGYGFIVDYIAEVLKELRKDDFTALFNQHAELDSSLTARDRDGITKTFSGLVKIIYPDGNISHEEAIELITFAVEGRKRVKDQLIIIDDTFEKVNFNFYDKIYSKSVRVDTLENIKYNKFTVEDAVEIDESNESDQTVTETQTPQLELKPGQVIIRDNQEGISFETLFGAYLKGAKKIKLVDPYIRMPHQMKNLLEFCLMLARLKDPDDEIQIKVITWNEPDEMLKITSENLIEISDSVFDLGIKLSWDFNPNQHDRFIEADNGWKIILGRGLDIFLKPEGRFNVAELWQEKRKCRACEITYVRVF
jgi:ATP-dependent Lon protease